MKSPTKATKVLMLTPNAGAAPAVRVQSVKYCNCQTTFGHMLGPTKVTHAEFYQVI